MTDEAFLSLCTETFAALGLDLAVMLAKEGEVSVDGVRIGLYYRADEDEFISCFVDIGEVEESQRPAVFESMLTTNLSIDGVHGESIGLDADSGHLVMRATIHPLLMGEASDLAESLRDYADFALNLRTDLLRPAVDTDDSLLDVLV